MPAYTTTLECHLPGDDDVEFGLEIDYTVTPGSDDYNDGQQWQQGWAAEAEVERATLHLSEDGTGIDITPVVLIMMAASDSLHDALIRHHEEEGR